MEPEAARQNPLPRAAAAAESMLEAALKEENTSGAPFPKARRVTPASDWEIFRCLEILAKMGDRQASAVDPRTQKHVYKAINYTDFYVAITYTYWQEQNIGLFE